MQITVDVNINAPELTAAILTLSSALQSVTIPTPVMHTTELVQDCCKSKSEFSFPLQGAATETAKIQVETNQDPEKTEPETEPDSAAAEAETEPDSAAAEAETDPEPETEPAPVYTLEQVRAKLAALSQAGKQAQVKKLITDCGASKLTEIPAEKYADLLAAAEEI